MTPLARLREWLFRSAAIARARSVDPSTVQCRSLRIAKEHLRAAQVLQHGDVRAASLVLREALYWTLLATNDAALPEQTLTELLATYASAQKGADRSDLAHRVAEWVAAHDPHVDGFDREDPRPGLRSALALVEALVADLDATYPSLAALRQWRRSVVLFGLLVVAAAAWTLVGSIRAWTNLARGKPWHASSAYEGFATNGIYQHAAQSSFFHTRLEANPSVVFDLGSTDISTVTISNRCDGFRDRAVPLVVELSSDGVAWREVARTDTAFTEWVAAMAKTSTRFVRLRSPRETYLHLCAIEIR